MKIMLLISGMIILVAIAVFFFCQVLLKTLLKTLPSRKTLLKPRGEYNNTNNFGFGPYGSFRCGRRRINRQPIAGRRRLRLCGSK